MPGGSTVYRYQQMVAGLDVFGAEAVVSQPADGAPQLVADSTSPGLVAPGRARISRARALGIAERAGAVRTLRGAPTEQEVVLPGGTGTAAWRVTIPARKPLADLEVLVDAASGTVLSTRNLLEYRTGQARLYDPNPVAEQGSAKGLRDRNDANYPRLTRLRRERALPHIQAGQDCLVGRWVTALLYRARKVCDPRLDWRSVKRHDDRFEALMAYYHVDRTQAYIHALGFHQIDNRRQTVRVDVHGLGDESFYSPATKVIDYGTGGVDDAEDGDIVIHEYGHSIQDNQDPNFGFGWQANSLGEGFGDYLSATMTYRSPNLPHPDVAAACIFDWDGTVWGLPGPCGRTADDPSTYPQAQVNCFDSGTGEPEPHCMGQVWSSALLDLRHVLGGRVLDSDLLASQFDYVDDETFAQAVNALVAADDARYGGTHKAAICQEMTTQREIPASSCP